MPATPPTTDTPDPPSRARAITVWCAHIVISLAAAFVAYLVAAFAWVDRALARDIEDLGGVIHAFILVGPAVGIVVGVAALVLLRQRVNRTLRQPALPVALVRNRR